MYTELQLYIVISILAIIFHLHTQLRDLKLMSLKHGNIYSELIRHFADKQEWGKVLAMCEDCIDDGIVSLNMKSTTV